MPDSRLQWNWVPFESLTSAQLYDLLKLRQDVFIVEQDCVYHDLDNEDQKAIHLLGTIDSQLVACCRVFTPGARFPEASIGRVVVSPPARGIGAGHHLMNISVDYCVKTFASACIRIDAQAHLIAYYQQHGFEVCSEEHIVDGILHVTMMRSQNSATD